MLFADVGAEAATKMAEAGHALLRDGRRVIRLVTSWQTTDDDIDRALDITATAVAA